MQRWQRELRQESEFGKARLLTAQNDGARGVDEKDASAGRIGKIEGMVAKRFHDLEKVWVVRRGGRRRWK